MNFHAFHIDPSTLLTIVSTGSLAKILVMAARTMPPPPDKCGFWCRWAYDFIQQAGENSDKVGSTRKSNPTENKPVQNSSQ